MSIDCHLVVQNNAKPKLMNVCEMSSKCSPFALSRKTFMYDIPIIQGMSLPFYLKWCAKNISCTTY